MKTVVSAVLVTLIVVPAFGLCRDTTGTPRVRIVFEGCSIGDVPTLRLQVGGMTRTADNKGSYFEANFGSDHVDAKMDVTIAVLGTTRQCCIRREALPVPGKKNDCMVQYTVPCDKPEWKLKVETNPPGPYIRYARVHTDGVDGMLCTSKPDSVTSAVAEFSERDDAVVTVILDARTSFEIPVKLRDLIRNNGTLTYQGRQVKGFLEQSESYRTAMKEVSAAARPLLTKNLPQSVTVTRQ